MDDEEFREVVAKTIGAVVHQPEIQKLAGSGKVFAFGTLDGPVAWHIDATGDPVFGEGTPVKFDVRAQMVMADWVALFQGRMSPTQAMLRKKLKTEGDVMAITGLSMDALVRSYKEQIGSDK
jgi:putative sterol carrier protein